MPFFSIIIPSYNSERFLPKCLGQCRRQTFRDFELVITDDASSDGSADVIRSFIAASPDIPVTFLPSDVNHGIGYSKGLGLKHARGEYVVFHDSDDWMDDDFLERGYAYLKDGGPDKLRFRIRVLNEATGRVRVRGTTPRTSKWTEGMFHATFFRRSVFTDNGISLSESRDVGEDLYAQVLFNRHCSSFLCVPEAKYTFLYRADSTSGYLTWRTGHCLDIQRETDRAIIGEYRAMREEGSPDADECLLLFTKQYYFMLLQFCRRLPFREALGFYRNLRAIQDEYFPGYLGNRRLTLLRDNGEPPAFRAVIFICAFCERHGLMSLLLRVYSALDRRLHFQTK